MDVHWQTDTLDPVVRSAGGSIFYLPPRDYAPSQIWGLPTPDNLYSSVRCATSHSSPKSQDFESSCWLAKRNRPRKHTPHPNCPPGRFRPGTDSERADRTFCNIPPYAADAFWFYNSDLVKRVPRWPAPKRVVHEDIQAKDFEKN